MVFKDVIPILLIIAVFVGYRELLLTYKLLPDSDWVVDGEFVAILVTYVVDKFVYDELDGRVAIIVVLLASTANNNS
jgi:hypothetical protein